MSRCVEIKKRLTRSAESEKNSGGQVERGWMTTEGSPTAAKPRKNEVLRHSLFRFSHLLLTSAKPNHALPHGLQRPRVLFRQADGPGPRHAVGGWRPRAAFQARQYCAAPARRQNAHARVARVAPGDVSVVCVWREGGRETAWHVWRGASYEAPPDKAPTRRLAPSTPPTVLRPRPAAHAGPTREPSLSTGRAAGWERAAAAGGGPAGAPRKRALRAGQSVRRTTKLNPHPKHRVFTPSDVGIWEVNRISRTGSGKGGLFSSIFGGGSAPAKD